MKVSFYNKKGFKEITKEGDIIVGCSKNNKDINKNNEVKIRRGLIIKIANENKILVCWATNKKRTKNKKIYVKRIKNYNEKNKQIIFSTEFMTFINPQKDIDFKNKKSDFDLEDINTALKIIYNSKSFNKLNKKA